MENRLTEIIPVLFCATLFALIGCTAEDETKNLRSVEENASFEISLADKKIVGGESDDASGKGSSKDGGKDIIDDDDLDPYEEVDEELDEDEDDKIISDNDDVSQTPIGGKGPEICRWFDAANPDFAEIIIGGPPIEVPIARYLDDGHWEGDHFFFTFMTYSESKTPRADQISLDARKAYRSKYNVIIANGKSGNCVATASLVFADKRWNGGCFAVSTKITMADGSEQFIAMINKGDQVYNPITGKAAAVAEVIEGKEDKLPMIEIGIGDRKVVVTTKHPFATVNGVKPAEHLRLGERVLARNGQYERITHYHVREVDSAQTVRNIRLEGDGLNPAQHMLLADGIVTGDLMLQRKLEIEANFLNLVSQLMTPRQ